MGVLRKGILIWGVGRLEMAGNVFRRRRFLKLRLILVFRTGCDKINEDKGVGGFWEVEDK